MQYAVSHKTTYSYADSVLLCQNQTHLTPRSTRFQSRAGFRLTISPEPSIRRSWNDAFDNEVWYFSIEEPHSELTISAESTVSVVPHAAPNACRTPSWERVRDEMSAANTPDLRMISQFCFESPYIRLLPDALAYASTSFAPNRPVLEAALELTARIYEDFEFDPDSTAITTTTSEVLRQRSGVCQDFAHLQITCLRSLGLAARYVSGYLLTDPPKGQPRMIGADASHAWLSLFCPGIGWIDLDPTNNCIPQQRHVTIGWGRDYGDVCPIKGVFIGGGPHSMSVAVDVAPIADVLPGNVQLD
jgi:transglutaminase-like putative cysteine protease